MFVRKFWQIRERTVEKNCIPVCCQPEIADYETIHSIEIATLNSRMLRQNTEKKQSWNKADTAKQEETNKQNGQQFTRAFFVVVVFPF